MYDLILIVLVLHVLLSNNQAKELLVFNHFNHSLTEGKIIGGW